jgi:hypothetical protein
MPKVKGRYFKDIRDFRYLNSHRKEIMEINKMRKKKERRENI